MTLNNSVLQLIGEDIMDGTTFWKNFNLGKELDIAGSFIYNGLHSFYLMESFYYEIKSI